MPYDTVSTRFIVTESICIFTKILKGELREKQTNKFNWFPNSNSFNAKSARDALIDSVADRIAQQVSDGIKSDVRREIKCTSLMLFGLHDINTDCLAVTKLSGIEQRAWMLLQAAGMYLFSIFHTVQLTFLNRISRHGEIDRASRIS